MYGKTDRNKLNKEKPTYKLIELQNFAEQMKLTKSGAKSDIAKRIFQFHGVDKNGKTVLKKKLMKIS